ncbi:autotransporter outer membrane beta-barrel domain-containing protein [Flavobacterium sp. SM15]|uniref:autotransporter outer membrane beta-barrel domain-containing protein n=1 Tax=Flavobacterium sp. SM15 TaxID=2908005 RepID=UPI002105457B|nr:autotransporter outer membrane beta-barrel domain-containing protein [Flavobacterium sp. SM15]
MIKKIALLGLLVSGMFSAHAQSKNEVKVNFLNTIVIQSVEVGYEHFIEDGFSVGGEVFINDRYSYFPEIKSEGYKFNTSSIGLNANFYFSSNSSGYYISPMLKYRFGDFEEKETEPVTQIEYIKKTDLDSFILGVGMGYKWVWSDHFAFAPYANISRNFSEQVNDRFFAVELNAGVSLGYRF